MSKLQPVSEAVRQSAVAAVAAAWESGCPVAGQNLQSHGEVADFCLRRIRSFARRGITPGDRASKVRDLARGMVAVFEDDPRLVGPLMRDYEYFAEQVLAAIDLEASKS